MKYFNTFFITKETIITNMMYLILICVYILFKILKSALYNCLRKSWTYYKCLMCFYHDFIFIKSLYGFN